MIVHETYNANGIRTGKTVNGVTHTFKLDGLKILAEEWDDGEITTLWDNEDNVCGIRYNGASYYFLKNLQGDIIAITNESGNVVARYSYDAWGACTIDNPTSADIATINPFRYRGYYYDSETQLYYLQSRYYDPAVARFVNVDEALILNGRNNVIAKNLFTYCHNTPINACDPTGYDVLALGVSAMLIAQLSEALSGIMIGISSSVAGLKAALVTSWFVPLCIAAAAVAVIGIIYVVNRVLALLESAARVVSAVKNRIRSHKYDPNDLSDYTVYVIVRKNTVDVVYVGITKRYSSRKYTHTNNKTGRFKEAYYTMIPIMSGLGKDDARAMEQTIITAYTLDTLMNIINSISPSKWVTFSQELKQMTTLILSWVDPE